MAELCLMKYTALNNIETHTLCKCAFHQIPDDILGLNPSLANRTSRVSCPVLLHRPICVVLNIGLHINSTEGEKSKV